MLEDLSEKEREKAKGRPKMPAEDAGSAAGCGCTFQARTDSDVASDFGRLCVAKEARHGSRELR